MPLAFEEAIAQFLVGPLQIEREGGILLAVSGGADSVAMLHVMAALRLGGQIRVPLAVGHVNHNLRAEAAEDKGFVAGLAARLGLTFLSRSVDVRQRARESKLSIETAGRQLRIAALAEMAHLAACTCVATAHHADDNAETVVHRLLRGSGFRGLAGIRPRTTLDGTAFIRPMLHVTRREILDYCARAGLAWRHDWTNDEVGFTRNRIRHRLLPRLESGPPGSLSARLCRLAQACGAFNVKIEHEAAAALEACVRVEAGRVEIDAGALQSMAGPVAIEVLRRALVAGGVRDGAISARHYAALLGLAARKPGSHAHLPAGVKAVRTRAGLTVWRETGARAAPANGQGAAASVPVPGKAQFNGWEIETSVLDLHPGAFDVFRAGKDGYIEWLDADRIEPPLVVRHRRRGDRFHPLGMSAEKRVGKFITAGRLDSCLRERLLVVEDQQRIVWLAPVRLAQPVAVTAETKRVVQVRIGPCGESH